MHLLHGLLNLGHLRIKVKFTFFLLLRAGDWITPDRALNYCLAHELQHLALRPILLVDQVAVGVVELELEAAQIETVTRPLLPLKFNKSHKQVLIDARRQQQCTYWFVHGANLKRSEGFHDFVGARILDTEFQGQFTALLDRQLRVPVAQVASAVQVVRVVQVVWLIRKDTIR